MLAILIIILLLLWAAVVWSIYSNFLTFYSNFSETENYHKALYASISALERWELVTKQRQPWYIWSGGFIRWRWLWGNPSSNDWWSDKSLSWLSYLWDEQNEASVFRTVNSRTKRIPTEWKWDVERMLSGTWSENYNMMDYENAEIFLLYYDTSAGNPYNKSASNIVNPFLALTNAAITWEIRLPTLLRSHWFWDLDDTRTSSIWLYGSLPTNDAIVDRQIRWKYYSASAESPFTIYSTQSLNIWGTTPTVNNDKDSVFRESDINADLQFRFWDSRSPLDRSPHTDPTIISQKEDDIKNHSWYTNLFKDWPISDTQIRFSLLNILWTWRYIYPFLEYYVNFWWADVSDKYFTINWEWNFKDYQVNTIIQKPTTKESVFWNFTSIF